MRLIANKHILNSKIKCNDGVTFEATYRGCLIYVSSDHGFGEPILPQLTRYYMSITGKDGGYLVDTWEDLFTINQAILRAIKYAGLI